MTNTKAIREAFLRKEFDIACGLAGVYESTWVGDQEDLYTLFKASRAQPIVLPQDKDIYGMDSAVILDKCKAAITAQGYAVKES